MEGFRQLDELGALKERLPAFETRLVLRSPLEAPLRDLAPEDLDLLQVVLNSPSVEAVFDQAASTDLATAKQLETLVRRGYLAPAS